MSQARKNRFFFLIVVCVTWSWVSCVTYMALAQDETVRPDGDATDAESWDDSDTDQTCAAAPGGACSSEDCYAAVDEDATTPDGSYLMNTTEATDPIHVMNMGNPSKNPSTATDAQEVTVNVSECEIASDSTDPCDKASGTSEPQIRVYLYCAGNQQHAIAGDIGIGGDEIDEVYSENWTFDPATYTDCNADGTNAQFGVSMNLAGKGTAQRTICYEAVEWGVTWESATVPMMMQVQ